ncbi:MAG: 16S rRNA (guanine(966)-N(2))-methyltransferase RsmD [Rhodospirillales bacterium]|nr:16S rRNA (guanine(966)-N(2))-methyltransferase RsmD [Rhodospirillales bacterium]
MRIVAGKYGRRRLEQPKGRDIRPTGDKVRGAIFNALQAQGVVDGARSVDCFCGTGALGLEALSRGAAFCTFIDKDPKSLALAKGNAECLGALDQCGFILGDAGRFTVFRKGDKYDLVFLDPPYRKCLIDVVLQHLSEKALLEEGAVIVAESEKGYEPNLSGSYTVQSTKIYGDTQVLFLRYT